jgi:hypothetical protein
MGATVTQPSSTLVHNAKEVQKVTNFIPVYKSRVEDLSWASTGMVASIISGDTALALQQVYMN